VGETVDSRSLKGTTRQFRHPQAMSESSDRLSNPIAIQAASMLLEHLFAPFVKAIDGIEFAIEYKLAEGQAGGDIVDVYEFDNRSVAFSVADISGKGLQAAMHAGMIKYGLRAYASAGFVAEQVMRFMNRLISENNEYENTEAFASAFFAHIDVDRNTLVYASAAHDSVIVAEPDAYPRALEVTGPLLGIFTDEADYVQHTLQIHPGMIMVAVTDGVTEAHKDAADLFGTDRLIQLVDEHRGRPVDFLATEICRSALAHCGGDVHDDIAILAVRFLDTASA
jgi:serine phosphatase RsbU (regulator of sigma subunit)